MEGSESEEIFDSLNVNPNLFTNDALNLVDDLLDDAFHFFHQNALSVLKTEGTDRSEDLSKGIDHIRKMIQSALDKRLGMWEKYCLEHCFAVPEGFSLPRANESPGESSICLDTLHDQDLDAQLDSLREKLTVVGKESAELNSELQVLERQLIPYNHFSGLVNEALQIYEQNSVHDMFQEMVRTASELRMSMEKLKTRSKKEIECIKTDWIYNSNTDLSTVNYSKGLSSLKLEGLQEFSGDMKNM